MLNSLIIQLYLTYRDILDRQYTTTLFPVLRSSSLNIESDSHAWAFTWRADPCKSSITAFIEVTFATYIQLSILCLTF